jgi:carboxypeptidase Taq
MDPKLDQLKTRLLEINDLNAAAAVLAWDQTTYMPPGGAPARARQLATLGKLAQEKFTDPAIGKLLDDLRPLEESLPYDADDASLIRVTRRNYDKLTKVPPSFMARLYSHTAQTYEVWSKARPANAFALVQPYLEQTLDLSRELAEFFPGYEHIADPLIDFADYGMKTATVRAVFAELREQLVPLVQAITAHPVVDDACLHRTFPTQAQAAFFTQVIQAFGYDLARGRYDVSPHPFTTAFSLGDVRITVRFKEDDVRQAVFSALHEAGHAMYQQGIKLEYEGTPLAEGISAGVHESQSRLWENLVGRSLPFWRFYYPKLQASFPGQLHDVSLEAFYQAINKAEPSLIRVDADEVTYNLHVLLRFDLEVALLEGKLAVRDLPEAWRARYQADLGIVPPDDRDGVLQDAHWYGGIIGGAFQGYTLGNIRSVLFYDAAVQAHPQIPTEIGHGQFATLHGWLNEHLYQHGSKYTASELIEQVTGGPLRVAPYINYLRAKYTALYKLG